MTDERKRPAPGGSGDGAEHGRPAKANLPYQITAPTDEQDWFWVTVPAEDGGEWDVLVATLNRRDPEPRRLHRLARLALAATREGLRLYTLYDYKGVLYAELSGKFTPSRLDHLQRLWEDEGECVIGGVYANGDLVFGSRDEGAERFITFIQPGEEAMW